MKRIIIPALFISLFLITGCTQKLSISNNPPKAIPAPQACTEEAKVCPDGSAVGRTEANCEFAPCPEEKGVIYKNTLYGFTLNFAPSWQDYSISSSSVEFGNKIVIRHPQWKVGAPREDVPILIYPLTQWTKWETTNFENYPTAAPIGPTERGRNNMYVFATAPRYNYDFQTGFEEVENIIKTLKTIPVPEEIIINKPTGCSCPEGYYQESEACNPNCYKTSPRCLMPSIMCTYSDTANVTKDTQVGLTNPASLYCQEQRGKIDIINNNDGSQTGNCILANGNTCEEWAYFRGTCK